MDNARFVLIVFFFFLSVMLYQQWQLDYGPKPVAPAGQSGTGASAARPDVPGTAGEAAGTTGSAVAGGGAYRTITPDDGDVEAILASLAAPLSAQQSHSENQLLVDLWDDLGPWLVLAVLPLAALSFRRGLLCAAFILLLPMPENSYALDWRDLWKTKDQQAAEAFGREQYDQAAEIGRAHV